MSVSVAPAVQRPLISLRGFLSIKERVMHFLHILIIIRNEIFGVLSDAWIVIVLWSELLSGAGGGT